MNKLFLTIYEDSVGKTLMNVDSAHVSINLIPSDAHNQYAPSVQKNYSYKSHRDALNIDECITLHSPYGWKVFDVFSIENQKSARLLPVLVTDFTSTIKISN